MEVKLIQIFDDDGYYCGQRTFQVMKGVFLPKNATEVPLPEGADLQTNFYKFNGETWVAEKKPTSADELVGVVIKHESQTAHDQELRKLIGEFAKTSGYRQRDRSKDLSWELEKISQEELDAQEIDKELLDFDGQVASLKDRMATAMLMDDTETVASLKAEYKTLMGA